MFIFFSFNSMTALLQYYSRYAYLSQLDGPVEMFPI
jgi:hypothetical protein